MFSIIYSISDGKGSVSTTEVNVPSSVSLVDVTAFAAALASLINPIITGAITRIGVVLSIALPSGLRATPGADSDVEEGARFQFNTVGGYFTGMRLPTFDESNIVPGSNVVDLSDGAVNAFVLAMTGLLDLDPGAGENFVNPTDKRGAEVQSVKFAVEQFLRSRGR